MAALRAALCCRSDCLVLCAAAGARGRIFHPLACSKKWCPDCVVSWSDDLIQRTLGNVAKVNPQHLRHLVLTIPSAPAGDLGESIRVLSHAFREWRNQGRRIAHGAFWKNVEGHAWKMEIEKHPSRAWHPHLHVLLHVPHGFEFGAKSKARLAWERITEHLEWPANRYAQYITTCRNSVGAAIEVAKYAAKPLQLAALNVDDLIELAGAAHGHRWTGGSGSIQPNGKPKGCGDYIVEGRLSDFVARAEKGEAYALKVVRMWQKAASQKPGIRANVPQEAMEI